jgi:hypothetical protein
MDHAAITPSMKRCRLNFDPLQQTPEPPCDAPCGAAASET